MGIVEASLTPALVGHDVKSAPAGACILSRVYAQELPGVDVIAGVSGALPAVEGCGGSSCCGVAGEKVGIADCCTGVLEA